jgi:hypothetical protein
MDVRRKIGLKYNSTILSFLKIRVNLIIHMQYTLTHIFYPGIEKARSCITTRNILLHMDAFVRMYGCTDVCMYGCMYKYLYNTCMYACMHVCMYACMHSG